MVYAVPETGIGFDSLLQLVNLREAVTQQHSMADLRMIAKRGEDEVDGSTVQNTAEQGWHYLQRQAALDMADPLAVLVPLNAAQMGNRQNLKGKRMLRVSVNLRYGNLLVLSAAYEGGGGADRETAVSRG
ncbi:hypothetical protein FPSE_07934 [Fusarium pseudograminearum CS3096]|uniref:Uncharacterized protein n=1 Tax=Fusarium pseudograminearum (strain CS3096) TaxID=1028729 RepID=K3VG71_FUSPC|nr:hypothetical protein FPSE_07934 [Fusarium pseudograminearum CS3096]EKJ71833.1 hypothetical protein FPSE_07934 [Fusarium pseudograminearum CS3096]